MFCMGILGFLMPNGAFFRVSGVLRGCLKVSAADRGVFRVSDVMCVYL